MSDIVERLRLLVPSDSSGAAFDAVNEITRLRAEVERLRVALAEAIELTDQDHMALTPTGEAMVARWRAALAADKEKET